MMLPRRQRSIPHVVDTFALIAHVVNTFAFAFAVPCVWVELELCGVWVELKSKAPVE